MNRKLFFAIINISLFFSLYGQEKEIVEGEYTYKYGDQQSIFEAKEICYNLALRNALESYSVFVGSMSKVQNFQLRNDVIQSISSGYLNNLTVVEEKIDKNNNEVYYKLRAYIEPQVFKNAIKKIVERRQNFISSEFVMENKAYRILSIKEEFVNNLTQVTIVYQKKTTEYGAKRILFITYYDDNGLPIDGETKLLESLYKGEFRSLVFFYSSNKTIDIRLQQ